MLAICSDLDATPDARGYGEIMRFLNTTQPTVMGDGVGLEVGNSIYFDTPPGRFSYWNTDDAGREMVLTLMRSGHIDCLHSFGGLATSRAHAERALDELENNGCRLEVWVDHAVAPTNFGADNNRGGGDVPGSPAYHADRTIAHGVRFVWRGRVTSVIGQDTPPRWIGSLAPHAAVRTACREAAKRALGRLGSSKYAPHARNRVLWPARLRDGGEVWEFLRTNWHPGGVSVGDTAHGLAEVLTDVALDALARREGISVLYTHLGKTRDSHQPLPDATCSALRRLAQRERAGEILVTTTRRLLGYVCARDRVRWRVRRENDIAVVSVSSHGARLDLAGLTFESDDVRIGRIEVDDVDVACDSGAQHLMIPWRRLTFPGW